MTVNSKEKAWEEANRLFPTDYDKDEISSERAGYDIYRHYELNYYNRICDLGNRLEVIVNDITTNIWIDENMEEDKEKVETMVKANYATKELGKSICPLFEIQEYQKITLCIDGSKWNSNETEVKVYEGLKRNETWLGSDLVASYCDTHSIKWGVIEGISINHYNHGTHGENGGHFIVTAYVGKRTENIQEEGINNDDL
jgi:hypothetical protein